MKITCQLLAFSVLIAALSSCTALGPQATETPVPTSTSTATPTSEPTSTRTLQPTEPASPPLFPTPAGEPVAEWDGIPIMPDALSGEEDNGAYSFTILASADEIQHFYETELNEMGWDLMATGQGETNGLLLIFMKDLATCSISIIPQPEGVMYVLLVQSP